MNKEVIVNDFDETEMKIEMSISQETVQNIVQQVAQSDTDKHKYTNEELHSFRNITEVIVPLFSTSPGSVKTSIRNFAKTVLKVVNLNPTTGRYNYFLDDNQIHFAILATIAISEERSRKRNYGIGQYTLNFNNPHVVRLLRRYTDEDLTSLVLRVSVAYRQEIIINDKVILRRKKDFKENKVSMYSASEAGAESTFCISKKRDQFNNINEIRIRNRVNRDNAYRASVANRAQQLIKNISENPEIVSDFDNVIAKLNACVFNSISQIIAENRNKNSVSHKQIVDRIIKNCGSQTRELAENRFREFIVAGTGTVQDSYVVSNLENIQRQAQLNAMYFRAA